MSESPEPGPGPPPLQFTSTDLSRDHINWLKRYQPRYDIFYATEPARQRGQQKLWVTKNVMGHFQKKFGQCSDEAILNKVDRYYRNCARRTQKVLDPVIVPPTVPRAVNWTQIMACDKKDLIQARIAQFRETEGKNSPADRLRHHHRAVQELVDSLSETEIKHYQELAGVVSATRKAPPTPEAIYALQPNLSKLVSSVIQERLGWKTGQFGDAICFFAVAYRTENQDIKTQFSLASNHRFPQSELMIPALSQDFSEFANPHLKSLAEKYIPRVGMEQPRLEVNIDELTPIVLRETLLQHIVASWVASDPKTGRTPENLPWADLSINEIRDIYLVDHADFEPFDFFCPTSIPSRSLIDFTTKIISSCPLFKPPPASGIPLYSSPQQDPLVSASSATNPDDFTPPEPEDTPSPTPSKQLPQLVEPEGALGPTSTDEQPPQPSTPPAASSPIRPSFTSAPPAPFAITQSTQPTVLTPPSPITPTAASPQATVSTVLQPVSSVATENTTPRDSSVAENVASAAVDDATSKSRKRKRGGKEAPASTRALRSQTGGPKQPTTIAAVRHTQPKKSQKNKT